MSISQFSSTELEYSQPTSVFLFGFFFFSGQEVAVMVVRTSHTPNMLVRRRKGEQDSTKRLVSEGDTSCVIFMYNVQIGFIIITSLFLMPMLHYNPKGTLYYLLY